MKILNLHIENIMRIKAVDITPDGNAVVISGKNGHGKTSAISSIAMALGGEKLVPERPVRDGEETAIISVDLGEYIVTRRWSNPYVSTLRVETKDGAVFKKGQSVLNRIVGKLSFDPLEFLSLHPQKRNQLLRDLTGLDLSQLDEEYEQKFDQRRLTKRDGEQLSSLLTKSDVLPKEKPQLISIEQIKSDRDKADAHNSRVSAKQERLRFLESQFKDTEKLCEVNKREGEELLEKLSSINNEIDTMSHEKDELSIADTSEFDKKLEEAYQRKQELSDWEQREGIKKKLKGFRESYSKLDTRLKQINDEKKKKLAETDMPIDGLSIGSHDVLFNEIPFGQLCASEQIKISMSIAMALHPKLKLVIINNGSLLDSDGLREIEEIAEKNDYQVWIERVSDKPDENSVFIEEGEVKGQKVERVLVEGNEATEDLTGS